MSGHTPGPWHVCDEHEASHRWVIAQPDGSSVADCGPVGPWVSDEEADANARLIASAPDLLGVAEALIEVARVGVINDLLAFGRVIDAARAALANVGPQS